MRTITVKLSSTIWATLRKRCLVGHGMCVSVIPERVEEKKDLWSIKELTVFLGKIGSFLNQTKQRWEDPENTDIYEVAKSKGSQWRMRLRDGLGDRKTEENHSGQGRTKTPEGSRPQWEHLLKSGRMKNGKRAQGLALRGPWWQPSREPWWRDQTEWVQRRFEGEEVHSL